MNTIPVPSTDRAGWMETAAEIAVLENEDTPEMLVFGNGEDRELSW